MIFILKNSKAPMRISGKGCCNQIVTFTLAEYRKVSFPIGSLIRITLLSIGPFINNDLHNRKIITAIYSVPNPSTLLYRYLICIYSSFKKI